MFVGGGCEDPPEVLLPGATGGKQLHIGEAFICFPGVGVPTGLSEVDESESGGSGTVIESAFPSWVKMRKWSEFMRVVKVDHSKYMAMCGVGIEKSGEVGLASHMRQELAISDKNGKK